MTSLIKRFLGVFNRQGESSMTNYSARHHVNFFRHERIERMSAAMLSDKEQLPLSELAEQLAESLYKTSSATAAGPSNLECLGRMCSSLMRFKNCNPATAICGRSTNPSEAMSYYPIFLELTGRRCVVIGGGVVADRKVDGLLAAGAEITVVSPKISQGLRLLFTQRSIKYVPRKYQNGDLAGYALAFVATEEGATTTAVFSEARERGIWVNCADVPSCCDFILPAVIRRGELAVAISSGGASPAATRAIREELESYLTEEFAELVQTASEARTDLRQRSIHARAESWNAALKGEFRLLLRQGKAAEAKQLLLAQLEERSCD